MTTNATPEHAESNRAIPIIDADHPRRAEYLRWALELTTLPTATGREGRPAAWIKEWVEARPGVAIRTDEHYNIEVFFEGVDPGDPNATPIYFTAHLDHPAFVVASVGSPTDALLEFRGGVMAPYFEDARVVVHVGERAIAGTLTGKVFDPKGDTDAGNPGPIPEGERGEAPDGASGVFPVYACELDEPAGASVGDVATWELPDAEVIDDEFGGILHTNACDDLAAAAAALAAMEELRLAREGGAAVGDVRLLFTRAEEVGFVGAIGACKGGFMPEGSRVIALETSRSFPHDSPIHGGPIVRVGDRVSVFTPELTEAVSEVASKIAGQDSTPRATERVSTATWRWQRKLMAGGACEASVYCRLGYTSTCVCLPLGNYHNMADLAAVQAGTNETRPRVGREYVGVDDYFGMIDLLAACGLGLPDTPSFAQRVEKLWDERKFVLGER
ncbi:MAG: hypothetical protein RIB60_07390 [Phycisphaerales bacterium]